MASRNRSNKKKTKALLVAKGNQSFATGALVGATNALAIADQQLGAISWDHSSTVRAYGNFLQAGDTAQQVYAIKLLQGTPASSNIQTVNAFNVSHKGYVESGVIRRDKIHSVSSVKAALPTQSSNYFHTFAAITDLTEYALYVQLRSVRNDRDFSQHNDEVHPFSYETPNYTLLPLITDKESHMLQNLIHNVNLSSKAVGFTSPFNAAPNKNFVVFGINKAGGTGLAINTIANGTSITFMTINGTAQTITADFTLVNTLNKAIAAGLPAAATIENVTIANAGLAGQTANVDAMLFLGLPEDTAVAFDNISQVMPKIEVRLADGFSEMVPLYTSVVTSRAFEGTGLLRQLQIEFDENARLHQFSLENQPRNDFFPQAPSYLDSAQSLYNISRIEYYDVEENLTAQPVQPKLITVVLPAAISNPAVTASTAYIIATTATNTLTSLNNILSVWLESARLQISGHELKGSSTAATNFV